VQESRALSLIAQSPRSAGAQPFDGLVCRPQRNLVVADELATRRSSERLVAISCNRARSVGQLLDQFVGLWTTRDSLEECHHVAEEPKRTFIDTFRIVASHGTVDRTGRTDAMSA
jgi:hypothetical protein